jgi:hypothetical protein
MIIRLEKKSQGQEGTRYRFITNDLSKAVTLEFILDYAYRGKEAEKDAQGRKGEQKTIKTYNCLHDLEITYV